MILTHGNTPVFVPLHSLEGISVVDSHLNHVVSLASLADPVSSTSQLNTMESLLNFPGIRRAFHYYYENNKIHGIPSTSLGPSIIQLQPGETVASLLYLEKSPNYGLVYNILLKEYIVEEGVPSFSEENIDCINVARPEHIRKYFNRVNPNNAVLSTLISLANAIYLIDHGEDEEIMSCLEARLDWMEEERKKNIDNPSGLLLAPYGCSTNGLDFGIEPETPNGHLTGIWKEDFYELLMNFRVYIPPLLEYINNRKSFSAASSYINSSIGPIRLKDKEEEQAEGLFLHIRSNSGKGFEFWIGNVPYEGTLDSPQIFYDKITVKKKDASAGDILSCFPMIDSLDMLLPLFLQASREQRHFRSPEKSISEIITECRRNHPHETRFALEKLARDHSCTVPEVTEYCPEDEIRETLYNSIRVSGESRSVIHQMMSYKKLGSVNGILLPGSKEEFEMIKKERIRAVREAEYKKRFQEMNKKVLMKTDG